MKENEGMLFKKVERYPSASSMVNSARREVESDLELESVYTRNNVMNTTNQSISSSVQQSEVSRNGGNGFNNKFEKIREDWAFEEGSNVETAYMMLQKKRFTKKYKKENDWSKKTADEKMNMFKKLKNNNVPVPGKK